MSNKQSRTELYELGEFRLIDRLTEPFQPKNPSTAFGIGDDCAVISPKGKKMVVTTDLLLEGIHFDLTYFPLKHLGYKAVIVNLSDVYAMNAIPTQITVSLGISKRFCVEDLEELYAGIKLACERYNVDLVGGDTSSSYTGLTISVTAIGEVNESDIVYRNGAQVNDLICVTGNLGAAYMGLQLLEREKKVFENNGTAKPQLKEYDYILERILKPEARKNVIDELKEKGVKPTSMIDISDGLSSELLHICKNSDKGCRVYLEKIPIDEQTSKMAEELGIEPSIAALNGGEDYELLFTVPISNLEAIAQIKGVSIIGHITEATKGAYLVTPSEDEIKLTAQGWNAIKKE
ncbi:MAG TPA: thiamine-phosphate kinase [Tenuifilaceae bacterium]|nr:thiamine-phosphate kinase [Tenuifilaceae bacterium]HPI43971.1 thiamine-phosphate kinase [Tenuifilaceae bacterium]HPN21844.1 thiamine-phosphate kinase [Tenuifilaceae bacterium]HPV56710.1 thiamine-phosphate kinase [Tenuifilaceae bacterium]